jgi:hypothetical protein
LRKDARCFGRVHKGGWNAHISNFGDLGGRVIAGVAAIHQARQGGGIDETIAIETEGGTRVQFPFHWGHSTQGDTGVVIILILHSIGEGATIDAQLHGEGTGE